MLCLCSRASLKERGIQLIEEKLKPAFQKIHDYYLEVSKDNAEWSFHFTSVADNQSFLVVKFGINLILYIFYVFETFANLALIKVI